MSRTICSKLGLGQFPIVIGGIVPVVEYRRIVRTDPLQRAPAGRHLSRQGQDLGRSGNYRDQSRPEAAQSAITVVHRSDGSGTTFNWTNYLSKVSPEWKDKVGEGTAVEWPVGLGGKGNEGVAAFVTQTKNSIGYVEYAYVLQNNMTYGLVQNKDR